MFYLIQIHVVLAAVADTTFTLFFEPCDRDHIPVSTVERLIQQILVVTMALENRTPSAARRSILGVCRIVCPAQPKESWR